MIRPNVERKNPEKSENHSKPTFYNFPLLEENKATGEILAISSKY
jgi:hypothetical protein